ncbi:MAG: hypothetical protein JSR48_02270 [Verrucomicrobia bacterium]|nr:hypothetical protein [Verrucomicrobiota bacterium]
MDSSDASRARVTKSAIRNPRSAIESRAFTLLEILLGLALASLVLVALNVFVFSMGEIWGRNTDVRLFDRHVRAVTRFMEAQLRAAALPPAADANASPITPQEIRPRNGPTDNLLTFELPGGCRLFVWPDRPLPEVVCSLQVRDREGLVLLWHSRLETHFADDPPRETVVTPLVTGISYDYYDPDLRNWKNETSIRKDNNGQLQTPQRLRLKFAYGKFTRETVLEIPRTGPGLPNF